MTRFVHDSLDPVIVKQIQEEMQVIKEKDGPWWPRAASISHIKECSCEYCKAYRVRAKLPEPSKESGNGLYTG